MKGITTIPPSIVALRQGWQDFRSALRTYEGRSSWKKKGLSNLAQCDTPRCARESRSEALDWLRRWFETKAEGLMMHRHDELRAGVVCHSHCFLGRAMRLDPGVIAADADNREVDSCCATYFRKAVGKSSIACEEESTAAAFEKISIVTAEAVVLQTGTPMSCAQSAHSYRTGIYFDGCAVIPAQLGHRSEVERSQQVCCSCRRDDGRSRG